MCMWGMGVELLPQQQCFLCGHRMLMSIHMVPCTGIIMSCTCRHHHVMCMQTTSWIYTHQSSHTSTHTNHHTLPHTHQSSHTSTHTNHHTLPHTPIITHFITHSAIVQCLKVCGARLRYLDISRSSISYSTLAALPSLCPLLEVLRVGRCMWM